MIGILIVLLVVVVGAWCVVAMAAGMQQGDKRVLDSDEAKQLRPKVLVASPAATERAYETALNSLPGVTIVDHKPGCVIVDSKPSVRMMGGAFGLMLQFDFASQSAGSDDGPTVVSTRCAHKLTWAPPSLGVENAATEIERKARMKVKQTGIAEVK